jgi:hypothetical protein
MSRHKEEGLPKDPNNHAFNAYAPRGKSDYVFPFNAYAPRGKSSKSNPNKSGTLDRCV